MTKISQLPNDNLPTGSDYLSGVQQSGTVTKGFKLSDILTWIFNNIPNNKITPAMIKNQYKFRVRRVAAWNLTQSAEGIIQFDTIDYDTNNNFDIVTNIGRYTIPINGFYQINAKGGTGNHGGYCELGLYKNGVLLQRGEQNYNVGSSISPNFHDCIQFVAGDYIDIRQRSDTNNACEVGTGTQAYFSGFLVCAT